MIGDGTVIEAIGIGIIRVEAFDGKKWIDSTLINVPHCRKFLLCEC